MMKNTNKQTSKQPQINVQKGSENIEFFLSIRISCLRTALNVSPIDQFQRSWVLLYTAFIFVLSLFQANYILFICITYINLEVSDSWVGFVYKQQEHQSCESAGHTKTSKANRSQKAIRYRQQKKILSTYSQNQKIFENSC